MSVKAQQIFRGFTVPEMMIVIAGISLLASIVYFTYAGIQERAFESSLNTGFSTLKKAIQVGRNNKSMVLKDITQRSWTASWCRGITNNPADKQPIDLPKTHVCWVNYYEALDNISEASGMNLNGLKAGDKRGNPYVFEENEGYGTAGNQNNNNQAEGNNNNQDNNNTLVNSCTTDKLVYFTGKGDETAVWGEVPLSGYSGCN